MNSLRIRIINRRYIKSMIMHLQAFSSSACTSKEIKIPTRIERSPTDILQALESTVNPCPEAPEYKYMDDPYLIPTTEGKKRNFILARESGKRAARWIIHQHGELFKSNLSEPLIDAYVPKIYKKEEVSNEILIKLLEEGSYTEAFEVYKLLEKQVPIETKLALFEILCYYNSNVNNLTEDYPEEVRYETKIVLNSNQWKENRELGSLFDELIKDDRTRVAAYNAMICGTIKYFSIRKAMTLYNECKEKKIEILGKSYCYLIRIATTVNNQFLNSCEIIKGYLEEMIEAKIPFDLEVLNAILESMSFLKDRQDNVIVYSLDVLDRFISLGVKPSLATYYFLLLIYYPKIGHYKHSSRPAHGAYEKDFELILTAVEEQKHFTWRHIDDGEFYPFAMKIIKQNYYNQNLAHRLYEHSLENKIFLSNIGYKNQFYNNYLWVMLSNLNLEEFLEFYDKFVPHTYTSDVPILVGILKSIGFRKYKDQKLILKAICRVLSDVIAFEYLYSNILMNTSFEILDYHMNHDILRSDSSMRNQVLNYVWKCWLHLQYMKRRVKFTFSYSPEIFYTILCTLIEHNEYDKFMTILSDVVKIEDISKGHFKFSAFQKLVKTCLQQNRKDAMLLLLEYCKNNYTHRDVENIANSMKEKMELDEAQLELVNNFSKRPLR